MSNHNVKFENGGQFKATMDVGGGNAAFEALVKREKEMGDGGKDFASYDAKNPDAKLEAGAINQKLEQSVGKVNFDAQEKQPEVAKVEDKLSAGDIARNACALAGVKPEGKAFDESVGRVFSLMEKNPTISASSIEASEMMRLQKASLEIDKQPEKEGFDLKNAGRVVVGDKVAGEQPEAAFDVSLASQMLRFGITDNPELKGIVEGENEYAFDLRSAGGREGGRAADNAFMSLMAFAGSKEERDDKAEKGLFVSSANHNFDVRVTGSDADGKSLVDTQKAKVFSRFFVPHLAKQLGLSPTMVKKGGGDYRQVAVRVSSNKILHKGEMVNAEETLFRTDSNTFKPKRLTTKVVLSNLTEIYQPNIVGIIRDLLLKGVIAEMQDVILTGSGSGEEPRGLINFTSTAANLGVSAALNVAGFNGISQTFAGQTGLQFDPYSVRVITSKKVADYLKSEQRVVNGSAFWKGSSLTFTDKTGVIDDDYVAISAYGMPKNGATEQLLILQLMDVFMLYWQNANILIDPFGVNADRDAISITLNAYWNLGEAYNGAAGAVKCNNIA
jgi:hypothetical protein